MNNSKKGSTTSKTLRTLAPEPSLNQSTTSTSSQQSKQPKRQQKQPKHYTIDNDITLPTILSDLPQVMSTINNYNLRFKELRTALAPTLDKITNQSLDNNNDSEYNVQNGISFLQLRTQLLTQYNMNLLQYLMLRADGRKIQDHPCLHRLIHLRVIMEKIRPIFTQLQYQIDQILQQSISTDTTSSESSPSYPTTTSTTSSQTQSTQLSTHATLPELQLSKEQIAQQKKQDYLDKQRSIHNYEQDTTMSKLNKNVKFQNALDPFAHINNANVGDDAASQWHAQENQIARMAAAKEKIRDKALYTGLVSHLRQELTDRPMEESATGLSMHKLRSREQLERTKFEEENFIRIQENKQQRKKQKRLERLQGTDDIEDVADFRALYHFDKQQEQEQKRLQSLRDYEVNEAREQYMDKIGRSVAKQHNDNKNKRKKPSGGF